MTTLPQTTGVRLPRPTNTGQLAGTNNNAALASGGPQVSGMTGSDVMRVLRTNAWLIIGMLVISCVGGWGLNEFLKRNYPEFKAFGMIRVENPSSPLSGSEQVAADLGVIQRSQAVLLKQENLINTLLQMPGSQIRKTDWFKSFGGDVRLAKQAFLDHYTVTPIPETTLVRIEFSDSRPKDAKTILEEVIQTHLDNQKKSTSDEMAQKQVQLSNYKVTQEQKLEQVNQKMRELAMKLNLEGGSPMNRLNLKEMDLTEMVRRQSDLTVNSQHAAEQYNSIMNALNNGQTPAIVENMLQQNQLLQQLKLQKEATDIALQETMQIYGINSRQYTERKLTYQLYKDKFENTEAELRSKAILQVKDEFEQLVQSAVKDLEILNRRIDSAKVEMGQLAVDTDNYLRAVDESHGLQERLRGVDEKLTMLNTVANTAQPVRVGWSTHPDQPNILSFPKLWMIMTGCILLGLTLSLGIAFLRELTDQSVRSPRDIQRVGQMNLLGMVPEESDDPQAAGARLPLVIFDAPHSMTAEQLRQVRTRLQHAASLDTTRSIMVTSPGPDDGKTTIACNLAAGLALNGRRILLVDGNFRRPEIHRIFGVGNERGFSDVLGGSVAFDEAVHETSVPNLSVMTSGPKPINATEMFESQLLIDFIERCLEEFDHVVFDSGPMMVVAEASAMAPRVDGVVSVVRARANSRGLLQRMRDDLRKIKAEHLGVVLNAVRARGGGYYGQNIKTYYEYQNT